MYILDRHEQPSGYRPVRPSV